MFHFCIGDFVETEPLAVQASLTDRHFPHGADYARCALFAVSFLEDNPNLKLTGRSIIARLVTDAVLHPSGRLVSRPSLLFGRSAPDQYVAAPSAFSFGKRRQRVRASHDLQTASVVRSECIPQWMSSAKRL